MLLFLEHESNESNECTHRYARVCLPDGSDFVITIVSFIRGIREIRGRNKKTVRSCFIALIIFVNYVVFTRKDAKDAK